MQALILAAGEGTRLRPLTLNKPKPMLRVGSKPLLAITIDQLRNHGIVEIAINLHHHPEVITDHFGDGSQLGVQITYSYEPDLLGTAGASRKLAVFLDETFIVVYGDVLTNLDYSKLVKFHRLKSAVITISLYKVENPMQVGLVGGDEDLQVTRFIEKPHLDEVFTDRANSGILVCEPTIHSYIPPDTFYDFGHDLYPLLLAAGEPLYGVPLAPNEYLIDIGTLEKYWRAQHEWSRLANHHEIVQ